MKITKSNIVSFRKLLQEILKISQPLDLTNTSYWNILDMGTLSRTVSDGWYHHTEQYNGITNVIYIKHNRCENPTFYTPARIVFFNEDQIPESFYEHRFNLRTFCISECPYEIAWKLTKYNYNGPKLENY